MAKGFLGAKFLAKPPAKRKKSPAGKKKARGVQLDQYRRIREEAPEKAHQRMQQIEDRKQLLEAHQQRVYRTELERITGELERMPPSLQRAEVQLRQQQLSRNFQVA